MKTPVTILIIDDNQGDRTLVKEYLSGIFGYEYHFLEASSGTNALLMYRQGGFDCVLLDFMIRDMDGIEFLKALDHQNFEEKPIILITHYLDETIAEKAKNLGAADFLPKETITAKKLHKSIVKTLKKEKKDKTKEKEKKKILIIDDNAGDRELYKEYLRKSSHDYTIFEAHSGDEGLSLFKQHQPDCTILDFIMTDKHGLDTLMEITRSGLRKVPIIFLTGHHSNQLREDALYMGAYLCLSKDTLTTEEFNGAVEDIVSGKLDNSINGRKSATH